MVVLFYMANSNVYGFQFVYILANSSHCHLRKIFYIILIIYSFIYCVYLWAHACQKITP